MALSDRAAFCDVAKPIWWSVKDTKKTVLQAKQHNCVGIMCGWATDPKGCKQ